MFKKIVFVIAIAAGMYVSKPEWFSFVRSSVSNAENSEVIIFTHSNCGAYCSDALELLKDKSIPHVQYNIQVDKTAEQLWKKMGGGNNFPVIHVGENKIQGYFRVQLTHALAAQYGLQVLDSRHRSVVERQMATYGSDVAVMYATEWCPYCAKAREYFSKNSIKYVEIDVEKSSDGMHDYKALDSSGYPLIYVGLNRMQGFGANAQAQLKQLF